MHSKKSLAEEKKIKLRLIDANKILLHEKSDESRKIVQQASLPLRPAREYI